MCGRFSQTRPGEEISKRFGLRKVPDDTGLKFNIAPDQSVAAIRQDTPNELAFLKWGLRPSWSRGDKPKYKMINARAETLLEKPSYSQLIRDRRCLIIADSFYEWQAGTRPKKPYRFMMRDKGLFAFAGLWDAWEKGGTRIESCVIITTVPNTLVKDIHDRMPVILPKDREREWLSDLPAKDAMEMLCPFPAGQMTCHEISSRVNNPAHNTPDILTPV